MQLAEVIGTLVATEKVDGLAGVKFLIVQPAKSSLHLCRCVAWNKPVRVRI